MPRQASQRQPSRSYPSRRQVEPGSRLGRRLARGAFLALVLLLADLSILADERGGAHRQDGLQLRGSSTYRPPAGIPRSLTPPAGLGSASNVGPDFYRQLDAPQPPAGAAHGSHGAGLRPGVIYVVPGGIAPYGVVTAPYAFGPARVGVDALGVGAVEGPDVPISAPAAEPRDQRPIVIINNPPAAEAEPSRDFLRRRDEERHPVTPPSPRSTEPMSIELSIVPGDALVYLDDELLGNGDQLAKLEDPLLLDPGVYVVEVTHPDHPSQRIVFGVGSKPLEVLVDLAAAPPHRRSRVRQ